MQEGLKDLVCRAEDRFALKIFDNIDRDAVVRLPLKRHARIVGQAVLERGGMEGFHLGRQILSLCQDDNAH